MPTPLAPGFSTNQVFLGPTLGLWVCGPLIRCLPSPGRRSVSWTWENDLGVGPGVRGGSGGTIHHVSDKGSSCVSSKSGTKSSLRLQWFWTVATVRESGGWTSLEFSL